MSEEEKSVSTQPDSTATTSSYRSIFKATSLFGGVQVYQILIRLIRSKIVAVLLGPLGIGIQGLMISATDVIKNIASLGLSQSAVRDISSANKENNTDFLRVTVTVVRRLVWITGLVGMLLVIVCSPLLSKISFGSNEYIVAFALLSITLLLDQVSAGQKVVLQGMRRLKDLAKASSVGVTIGLIVTVPFYYLWGVKGIVPALIVNSASGLIISWYYSNKVKIHKVRISIKETFSKGGVMIKMGVALCYSSVLVSISSYLMRGYISNVDGAEMVGLYTAGVAIASTYVGLIFTAMNADFYPGLAAVSSNNECRHVVNQQGEIGALILGPLVLLCVVFMPIVIRLLYSEKFLPSCDYVMLAIVGMLFRLVSWLVSIQFVAKGEARVFAINESISNIYMLILNVLGYKLLGLVGVGVSFIICYIVYFIQVFVIAYKKYDFTYSGRFLKIFAIQVVFAGVGLLIALLLNHLARYVLGGILCVILTVYSYIELNKRVMISEVIKQKVHAKK